MIIDIPDDIGGEERRLLIRDMVTDYAMTLFEGNKEKAAIWLGMTRKGLYNRVRIRNFEQCERLRKKLVTMVGNGIIVKDTKMWVYSTDKEKKTMQMILDSIGS